MFNICNKVIEALIKLSIHLKYTQYLASKVVEDREFDNFNHIDIMSAYAVVVQLNMLKLFEGNISSMTRSG